MQWHGSDRRSGRDEVNVAEIQVGLTAAEDVIAAIKSGLSNLPADEAVLGDALAIAGLVDPALVPFEVLLPILEFLIIWLIANNKLHPQRMITAGGRGSDPWMAH